MAEIKIQGRIWVLVRPDTLPAGGTSAQLYDDIDTDQIFHNRYLAITEVDKMGQYALDNLKGWEDFAKKAQPGDIILAGKNFGAGSSRQQAVDCFRALKIGAIVAESYGAIYKRNAINSGFPIVTLPNLTELYRQFRDGDELAVDFETGQLVLNSEQVYQGEPFSRVQMDIYRAGDLFAYGRTLEQA